MIEVAFEMVMYSVIAETESKNLNFTMYMKSLHKMRSLYDGMIM